MCKIKIILYSLITCAIIILFSRTIHSFDESYIAGNSIIIEINTNTGNTNNTKTHPKEDSFSKLQNFAHREHISLVKTRFNNVNGHQSKIVYDLGTKNKDFSGQLNT